MYTAILRKVVGKSARNNPERYCGWFLVHCSSKKFERMAQEAMDVCLRALVLFLMQLSLHSSGII